MDLHAGLVGLDAEDAPAAADHVVDAAGVRYRESREESFDHRDDDWHDDLPRVGGVGGVDPVLI